MRAVRREQEPREGKEAFDAFDVNRFLREQFGLQRGRQAYVKIRFQNFLLDAVIERIGTQHAVYTPLPDNPNYFLLSATVEVSDQFFSWLISFGYRAKLIGDEEAIERFRMFLYRIRSMY